MKILIVYATSEGQTAKVAVRVGDWVRERGHQAEVVDCSVTGASTNAFGFDAYIVAGSIHFGKHQKALIRFVTHHAEILKRHPSAFLSVCGAAEGQDEATRAEARSYVERFAARTGWTPTMYLPVAGAVKYTQYNWLTRRVMKGIYKKKGGPTDTSRDYEFTDWTALKAFVDDFCASYVEPQGFIEAADPATSGV